MKEGTEEYRAIAKIGGTEFYVRKVCQTEGVTYTAMKSSARVFEGVEEIRRVCGPWGNFRPIKGNESRLTKSELRELDHHEQKELF